MKLINYKRGYNNTFDCVIHGTIYMNEAQWDMVLSYLMTGTRLDYYGSDMLKKLLTEDIHRKIMTKRGYLINIRGTATELIVKKWNLNNYKKGNYQLHITPS